MGDTFMKIRGDVRLILYDKFGRIKKDYKKHNVITEDGRKLFANRLIQDSDDPIGAIGLGLGTDEALSSNSDLGWEPRNNVNLGDVEIDTSTGNGCLFLDGLQQYPSSMHIEAITNITTEFSLEAYYINDLNQDNRVGISTIPICSAGDTFDITLQGLDVAVKDVTSVKCIGGNDGEKIRIVGDCLFRKATDNTFLGNGTTRFLTLFDPLEATAPITEAGLFDVLTYVDFIMATRVTFPAVTKGVEDTLAVLWEITFSGD